MQLVSNRFLCYNLGMNELSERKQMDLNIVGTVLSRVYMHRIQNPDESLQDTCDALGYSIHTIRGYIKKGLFTDYIESLKDSRGDLAQALALNALPEIVQKMADVATGKDVMRGQRPQSAADFVLKVAQLGVAAGDTGRVLVQTNVYMPQMMKQQKGEEPEAPPPIQIIDA